MNPQRSRYATYRLPRVTLGYWACVLSVCALAACALPRKNAPSGPFSSATPVGFLTDIRHLSTDRPYIEATIKENLERMRKRSNGGTVRILALSGGGAGGAFGAGALVGLSRRGERPEYDVVTGVSTGALLAPFAFLGSEFDRQLTEAYTTGRGERTLSFHGVFGLLFGKGARRSAALNSLVDSFITTDVVRAVAREAATGRLLLVATTDLDNGEPVIWDMGQIAARGGEPARRLFRDVLVASASIPGLFRPVLIRVESAGTFYDEMHVDGNTATSMFVTPEAAYSIGFDPASLKDTSIYVLMNSHLSSVPSTTRGSLGSILSRSFAVALTHMARAQITAVRQLAEEYGVSFRLTWIPVDYTGVISFQARTMRTLFDYGARCGESGRLWTTIDQAIDHETVARSGVNGTTPSAAEQPSCPLLDVSVAQDPGKADGRADDQKTSRH
jgi:predicted acylesterase/phospholipase RssA